MNRADFETEVKDFVLTVEYTDGCRYELDPEEQDEPPRGTIIVEVNGEEDYHIPVFVFVDPWDRRCAGINTWEDNYIELDREGFYAWMYQETLKRLRAERAEREKKEAFK